MSEPSVIDPAQPAAPTPPAAGFRVLLLGELELSRDGVMIDTGAWQRSVLSLLKLLAVAPGHRRSRDELIDILWPESTPEAGASNLRSALHLLRRGLGGGEPSPVMFERGWMELNRTYVWDVDLDRFEMLIRSAGDDPEPLQDALVLLRGEPLVEDRYDDWAQPVRERVLRLWRDAGLRLTRRLEAAGEHEVALTWLEMLYEHDPLDEEAVQGMLRNLMAAGHRGEALRRYQAFAERLQEELAVAPEVETQALLTLPASNGAAHRVPTPVDHIQAGLPTIVLAETRKPSRTRRLFLWLSPLAVALLVTLPIILLVRPSSAISRTELSIYNAQFMQRGPRAVHSDILLVNVDQTSFDDLNGGRFPLPRQWLARAVTWLHLSGARAIGLNFLIDSPSRFGHADDLALARAIRQAGNVVVDGRLEPIDAVGAGYEATGLTLKIPIDLLLRSHVRFGIEGFPIDADGYVRSVDLLQPGPGGLGPYSRTYPTYALVLASVAEHRPIKAIAQGLPTTGMLINYVGSQDVNGGISFPEVQFYGLAKHLDSPSAFRNKIVILQYTASAAGEPVISTPVGQLYDGAQEANTLATILDRDPIRPAGDGANDLIILVLALLTAIIATRLPVLWSLLAAVLLAVGYVVLTAFLFREFNLWLEVISPVAVIAVSFVVGLALRMRTPGQAPRTAG